MQVSLDVTGPLERRVKVEVPEERIATEIQSRLRGLAQRANIAGFRPGKAPLKVVQRHFGQQVRGEVMGEVLRSSLQDALVEQKLRPAGEPTIEPLTAEPGTGLAYTATFEVYPEVELKPVETLELERPSCEITEADIDRMVQTLREQNKEHEGVERPIASGDQANIDFEGKVDGEPFEGGTATGVEVEVGANRLLPGFEEALIGKQAGDELEVQSSFPGNHPNPALADKPVVFQVKVNAVKAPRLPELDDAFFARFGVQEGGVERFREEVLKNMTRERDEALRNRVKQTVLTALEQANPLEVPSTLVQREARQIQEQMGQNFAAQGRVDMVENLKPEMFEQEAGRRVKLGLLLGDIITRNGLRPDPAKVRQAIERMAAGYEDPSAVVKWYMEDKSRLADIEASVLEDAAVHWVLERAQVTEVPVEFDALMNPRQTPAEGEAE